MTNHPRSQNENLKWMAANLPALLVALSFLKDFWAIAYLYRRVDNLEAEFTARLTMLPGGLLLWGYAGWFALVFNASFAVFLR